MVDLLNYEIYCLLLSPSSSIGIYGNKHVSTTVIVLRSCGDVLSCDRQPLIACEMCALDIRYTILVSSFNFPLVNVISAVQTFNEP